MSLPTKNFKRREFACHCGCGMDTVDAELLHVLDLLRFHFGRPITITSGCRCKTHNKRVGGAQNSQHLHGRAADIRVRSVHPITVYGWLNEKYPDKYGIGVYPKWVHLDTRGGAKARWEG